MGDWLCSAEDGRVLASVEMATERVARRVGLMGRPGIDGALFIAPTFAVHTMGRSYHADDNPRLGRTRSLFHKPRISTTSQSFKTISACPMRLRKLSPRRIDTWPSIVR